VSRADAEIAIVGGGPAGVAAALTLRRYTKRRVVLIERSSYADRRIGETVSSAVRPLLDYLGVPEILTDRHHLRGYGAAAAWGSFAPATHDLLFTGRGEGWHLDRLRFDAALADAVEHRGATVLRQTSLTDAVFEDGLWRLGLAGAASGEILAREVVDASGRACAFARRAGARRRAIDRLVGLAAFLRPPDGRVLAHETLVEAVEQGWWYSAPVPGRLVVAAFMTDADLLPSSARSAAGFLDLLAVAPLTSQRLAGCALDSPPRVRPAGSHLLQPCLGEGWVAAGDAVAAFDPLSSLGIGHALTSGIQAGRIVEARLRTEGALAWAYSGDVARYVGTYLAQRHDLYRREQRWRDRPFWSRRHADLASPGGSSGTAPEPAVLSEA
jgi:flavin-dependent dehydrogenase